MTARSSVRYLILAPILHYAWVTARTHLPKEALRRGEEFVRRPTLTRTFPTTQRSVPYIPNRPTTSRTEPKYPPPK